MCCPLGLETAELTIEGVQGVTPPSDALHPLTIIFRSEPGPLISQRASCRTCARHKLPHAPLLVLHTPGQQEPACLHTPTYLTDTRKLTSNERWTCTTSTPGTRHKEKFVFGQQA